MYNVRKILKENLYVPILKNGKWVPTKIEIYHAFMTLLPYNITTITVCLKNGIRFPYNLMLKDTDLGMNQGELEMRANELNRHRFSYFRKELIEGNMWKVKISRQEVRLFLTNIRNFPPLACYS